MAERPPVRRGLRMKNTPQDIEAILKKERRARRKRRKEEERTRPQDDEMTPPRASTSRLPADDIGFDESSVPPAQATKPDHEFYERLHDAFEEDNGVGLREDEMYTRETTTTYQSYQPKVSASFAYGGAAGVALGLGKMEVDAMDEEEYAEYMRAGLWRLKNKDEAERLEAIERERKIKEEKERIETEQRRKIEREKIRKLEEKAKKRGEKESREARERYETMWKKILVVPPPSSIPAPPPPPLSTEEGPQPLPPHPFPLRFTDFPWPLYPPVPFPPISWPAVSDISATAISMFLLDSVAPSSKKSTLRSAVLVYHPDRFERLLARIPPEKEDTRERIKELGLRVSQVLNDLLKASGGSA